MTGLHELRPQSASLARTENWKPVVGYEGFYEVSDFGHVRSIDRTVTAKSRWGTEYQKSLKGKVLKQTQDIGKEAYGRLQVKLSRENCAVTTLVHQIVLAAFVGPRPEGHEGAHWDGDASNNRLENLRYATPKENTDDKFRHGTVVCGTAVGNSKLCETDILRIRALHGHATVYQIAETFGISIAHVSRIQNGKRWAHVTPSRGGAI